MRMLIEPTLSVHAQTFLNEVFVDQCGLSASSIRYPPMRDHACSGRRWKAGRAVVDFGGAVGLTARQ